MPKNNGLKLFTKTWPLNREKKNKEEDPKRPVTATLEKPSILDVRFIRKIDMSMLRKEFMNISNLCRLPLVVKKKAGSAGNRPLSILSAETYKATKKKRKKGDPSDDSHEDEESSVISLGKVNRLNSRCRSRSSGRSGSNRSVINQFKQPSIQAIKNSINDANNNRNLKVPSRKPTLSTIPANPLSGADSDKSTKLPSPCKTCGRPDLPERFHSHPATPLKLKGVDLEVHRVPTVKSSVQKPIAIKYKSKITPRQPSPLKKNTSALPVPIQPKLKSPVKTPSPKPDPDMGKSLTPQRTGSGKRTLTCYICGREFGTASLGLHEPKCLQRWERENSTLPPNLRRKLPVKPEEGVSQQERDQLAWESSQSTLVPCPNCGRTFYPDRLEVHQRSCKKKTFHDSSSSMSQNSDPASSTKSTPPSVECYICSRMFGTHSIKIHEKQCLKKWHIENETLPFDMRSPAPTRPGKVTSQPLADDLSSSSSKSSPKSVKDERPLSEGRSPMFPCYLCGKLFTVNSIYIHEPQCLKMWKIENDKLPARKRRPVPLKPEVKFTHSGKLKFGETSDAYWQSHLSQLVPCKICSRTFNPERIEVHERSCKGN